MLGELHRDTPRGTPQVGRSLHALEQARKSNSAIRFASSSLLPTKSRRPSMAGGCKDKADIRALQHKVLYDLPTDVRQSANLINGG
jgi:hypothetical protein